MTNMEMRVGRPGEELEGVFSDPGPAYRGGTGQVRAPEALMALPEPGLHP